MVKNVGESSSDSGVSQKASAKQVKSSLVQFTKSGKRNKRKSKKRVTFSDDQTPERIPLWQRFVGFFHILWNCTRTSVQTALRKFSQSFFKKYTRRVFAFEPFNLLFSKSDFLRQNKLHYSRLLPKNSTRSIFSKFASNLFAVILGSPWIFKNTETTISNTLLN